MSAVEDLTTRAEDYEQKAREADPAYWNEKAKAARQNLEVEADRVEAEQRAARIVGTRVAEEYADAKDAVVEVIRAYIEVKNDYRAAKTAYAGARSTAIALGETIPLVDDLGVAAQSDYELKKLLAAHLVAINLTL